jgi:quinol monooxygenase YgiN
VSTVSISVDSSPDLTRAGTAVTIATAWRVGDAERQRLASDAIDTIWRGRAWPYSELLSVSIFGSVHGNTLLHYTQWGVEDTAALRERTQDRWRELDAEVPGIERLGEHVYRPYRGTVRRPHTSRPDCYVIVRAHFHRPDARRWADGVLDASAAEHRAAPGLIRIHLHLSHDGHHVLKLAEWTDEAAHQEQVEQPDCPVRAATRSATALDRITVERFRLLHHLHP